MTTTEFKKFVTEYIEAWSTTDSKQRQELVEKMYSITAEFYADEPGDKAVNHKGTDSIFGNISQVNDRLVVGNKLITELVNYSVNHNSIKVSWQMKTPNGDLVLKGMNFLQLDTSNKIEKDYIFIG
jgi:hypothetical protein